MSEVISFQDARDRKEAEKERSGMFAWATDPGEAEDLMTELEDRDEGRWYVGLLFPANNEFAGYAFTPESARALAVRLIAWAEKVSEKSAPDE